MKKRANIVIAILIMAIGFASISTTLVINGSTKVSENADDFSVIFTAAILDGQDVYTNVTSQDKKTITFETSDLKTLNQTSVLTYEVTNNSSNYDAEVQVNCKVKDDATAKYTSIKNELEGNATKVLAKNSVNGTLTVTLNKTATEEVKEEYVCTLEFNAVERATVGVELTQFEKDSWSTIAANVKSGNINKYKVGDTKEIELSGYGTHTVRISNMSACTNGETSETACGFVVEFADIIENHEFNSTATNLGGWRDSELRTYVNNTIYNSLPSDLQNVIIITKVISGHGKTSGETNFETEDKLYLLSSEEIYGNFANFASKGNDTATDVSKQLDYYKEQGTTTSNKSKTIKKYNGINQWWWLRSAHLKFADDFLSVTSDGSWSDGIAISSYGISPAFRIA